jgi:hypothetical protein
VCFPTKINFSFSYDSFSLKRDLLSSNVQLRLISTQRCMSSFFSFKPEVHVRIVFKNSVRTSQETWGTADSMVTFSQVRIWARNSRER